MSDGTTDVPTVTIMKHGPTRPSVNRPHDPPTVDWGMPAWAASMLTMDLGLSKKKKNNIIIVTSPFQRCIESAVVVAHSLGVKSIEVHYGLGESVSAIRTNGWDWAYCPLYLSPQQMHLVVANMEEPGKEISISGIYGRQMGPEDITERYDQIYLRVSETFDSIKSRLKNPGDHIVCVGHTDTIKIFVRHFGPSTTAEVMDVKNCGFVTLACPTQEIYWLKTRSRVKIFAEPGHVADDAIM
jgi:broad specificity phosphatase PhoE